MVKVTKREETGYAWATFVMSFFREMPEEKRREYYRTFVEIVDRYKFYSTQDSNGKHPRSIRNRKLELVSYTHKNPRSFGLFVARALEEGLVKETSEAKRKYFIKHLEKLMTEDNV